MSDDFKSVVYAINDVKEAIEQVSRRQEDFQNEVVKILKGIEHTIVDLSVEISQISHHRKVNQVSFEKDVVEILKEVNANISSISLDRSIADDVQTIRDDISTIADRYRTYDDVPD